MPEEDVEVNVRAVSEGEDVYARHAQGIREVTGATEEMGKATESTGLTITGMRGALVGINLSLLSVERGMHLFGVTNEVVTKGIDALVTVLTIARSALAIYKAVTESVTLANWARAASEIAASSVFAPVVLGIIIAAVSALLAYAATTHAAAGIDTVVTGPRTFLAGEGGPERVVVSPLGAGLGPTAWSIGTVNVTVVSPDPQAAGRSVADELIRLKAAGR